MKPTFSIITVTYNSENYIRRCLQSVLDQTYTNFEHIIIDGQSSDDTVKILARANDDRVRVFSERDNGIYDAMNKGLRESKGQYICILNSDDLFSHKDALLKLKEEFSKGVEIVLGNISYFPAHDSNIVSRTWTVKPFDVRDFMKGWHPPHPGFFFARNLYELNGGFDSNIDISADFELMLRYIKSTSQVKIINEVLTLMQDDGASSSVRNIIKGNLNVLRALEHHGMKVNPIIYLIRRITPKLVNIVKTNASRKR